MLHDPRMRALRAVTLIELLCVVAILSLLAAASVTPIGSVVQSSRLNGVANELINELNQARHSAIAKNRVVECRLYERADGAIDEVQLWIYDPSRSTATPLDRKIIFDNPVVIAANTTWSSALKSAPVKAPSEASPYVAFRFRPDGSTDLPASSPATLTLISQPGAEPSALKTLFFTAQIDPVTGLVRGYSE